MNPAAPSAAPESSEPLIEKKSESASPINLVEIARLLQETSKVYQQASQTQTARFEQLIAQIAENQHQMIEQLQNYLQAHQEQQKSVLAVQQEMVVALETVRETISEQANELDKTLTLGEALSAMIEQAREIVEQLNQQ